MPSHLVSVKWRDHNSEHLFPHLDSGVVDVLYVNPILLLQQTRSLCTGSCIANLTEEEVTGYMVTIYTSNNPLSIKTTRLNNPLSIKATGQSNPLSINPTGQNKSLSIKETAQFNPLSIKVNGQNNPLSIK